METKSRPTQYTKGEWKASKLTGDWVISTDDEMICRQIRHYNVHLIAAAPDMYEALKALLRKTKLWTGTGKYQDLLLELVDIEEALAKAEGK